MKVRKTKQNVTGGCENESNKEKEIYWRGEKVKRKKKENFVEEEERKWK